jgi:hypothetical protein
MHWSIRRLFLNSVLLALPGSLALACDASSDTPAPGTGGDTTMGSGTGTGGAQGTVTSVSTVAGTSTTGSTGQVLGGYYESGSWHGYAWAAPVGAGTTITPEDFSTLASGSPFGVSGSVGPAEDYGGVSLLGFNVNQGQFAETAGADPAIESAVPTGTGVAVNFNKNVASTLRIQIQGPAGESNANDRWCWEIADPAGPVFAPYAEFSTECWQGGMGTPYANQPITAVVFTVPGGNLNPVAYDYCISGFADGNSVADAPASLGGGGTGGGGGGPLSGTITDRYGKVKVLQDGKSYIVQNNAWGPGSADGSQTLAYTGTAFEVVTQTGTPGGGSEPASFPSVYIGANGDQGVNGSLTTSADDNLPIQISSITSINTSFSHNGSGAFGGDYNAAYDVWFAASPPTGQYGAAESGYLMVWLYRPPNRYAIGGSQGNVDIAGQSWEVFAGDRGDGSGAQVVSYVVQAGAPLANLTFDLNAFIQDAVTNSRGGFNGSWYLTDVFAGFEIWSGGAGLKVEQFSASVQ